MEGSLNDDWQNRLNFLCLIKNIEGWF